ncbi:glycoside hydrolase family 25 protein [Streptomyces sp. NPDC090306]|uniref:glycoside hydrolase family 25 protein n=1 Tax=Streptomyces sp. NPDC090306 TaxID=3365961 RepID=UPI003815E833
MTISGIDASGYQSETYDLTGVDFVFVKATESTTYVNPRHDAQVTRARNNDRVVGHYHFLRPGSMTAQVDYFLAHAGAQAGDVFALDWEVDGITCAEKDQALKYLQQKAPHNRVLLYCSRDFWLNRDNTSYRADGLWIAQYNGKPGAPDIEAPWLIHQWADTPVDQNVAAFSSRAEMAAWAAGDDQEDDDMPPYVNLGLAKSYKLSPGAWDSIEFTKEFTDETGDHATGGSVFARGAARFTGAVSLHFEGLPVGAVVQARMSEYDANAKLVTDHPIHEVIGTAGGTFAVIPLVKHLPAGHGMRVRLLNQAAGAVTVSSAVLAALVWKES